ncbi:microcephalin [Ambystoma mexicanum]|uniref:microcephalin n=1 Tax=Ambystoma mexicanum TaxID=8296 RepID=UPI0037E95DFF
MDALGCDRGTILEGVVAFVEVWSSNRTENYSKTFAQQLLNLGAKVSKFFNKEVTHVVFKDGYQGTWNKATKTGVKLVSVLWVEKCIEAGLRIDESSFPAINTNDGLPQIIKKKHKCMQPKDFIEKTPETDRRMQRKFDKMVKELDVQKAATGFDVPVLLFDEDGELMYSPKAKVVHRGSAMEKRIQEMKDRRINLSPTASQMSQPTLQSPGRVFKPSLGDTPSASPNASFQEDTISEPLNSSFEELFGKPKNLKMKSVVLNEPIENCSPMSPSCQLQLTPVKSKETPLLKTGSFFTSSETPLLNHTHSTESSTNKVVLKKCMSSSLIAPKSDSKNYESPTHSTKPEKRISSAFKSACEVFSEHFTNPETSYTLNLNRCGDKLARQVKSSSSLTLPASTSSPSHFKKSIWTGFITPPKSSKVSNTKNTQLNYEDFFSAPNPQINKHLNRFSLGALSRKSPSPPPIVPEKQHSLKSKRRRSAEESEEVNCNQSKKKSRTLHIRLVSRSTLKESKLKGRSKSNSTLTGLTNTEKNDPTANVGCKAESNSSPKKGHQSNVACSSPETNSGTTNMNTCSKGTHRFLNTLAPIMFTPPSVTEKKTQLCSGKIANATSVENTVSFKSSACMKGATEMTTKETRTSTVALTDCSNPGTTVEQTKQCRLKRFSLSPPNETSASNVMKGLCDVFSDQRAKDGATSKKKDRRKKATRSLVMTSMPSDKQQTVIQVVNNFGGFFFSDNVCETTTHVIAGNPRRTVNILLGIARGCWIVSFDWVLWSLEHGRWAPEEPYELSQAFPAAPICRLQRQLSSGTYQPDLFSKQPIMFISMTSQPPWDNLTELVQLCGGRVCKSLRQADICIGDHTGKKPAEIKCLSEKWILDSVTQHRICSMENYLI